MAENSKIQWCHHTFNPWRGCTKVSAGCAHCYAETLSARNPGTLGVWGPKGTRVVASEAMWREPVKWNREAAWCGLAVERPRVFCASLADVFEGWAGPMSYAARQAFVGESGQWFGRPADKPEGWVPGPNSKARALAMQDVRARLLALIDVTPSLDWLLLTKRPENVASMMASVRSATGLDHHKISRILGSEVACPPLPRNAWLGTSVENQAAADERIPHLLRVPAAVRFLSCEPLLSEVILHKHLAECECGHGHGFTACPNTGGVAKTCHRCDCRSLRPMLHWVIVGGESGPGARPCNVEWIRSIVNQCKAAGVACFVKQLGAVPFVELRDANNPSYRGRMESKPRDKKGGDMAEFPADLRVRQFPEPRGTP